MPCVWIVIFIGNFRRVACEPPPPTMPRASASNLARTAPHVPPAERETYHSGLPLQDRRLQSSSGSSLTLLDVGCNSSRVLYEQAVALNCTHIGGDLLILQTGVATLAQLSGLATVGGTLTIALNYALSSLTGLESLTTVGALTIVDNDALVDLHGLSNVTAVSRGVYVFENSQLANINGLCGATVSGSVEVRLPGVTYLNLNYCTTTYTFSDKASLQTAVTAWCADSTSAASVYGQISNWDVRLVTDMGDLFNGCTSLGNVDLSGWDVSAVTKMNVRSPSQMRLP
jgi:surface protein